MTAIFKLGDRVVVRYRRELHGGDRQMYSDVIGTYDGKTVEGDLLILPEDRGHVVVPISAVKRAKPLGPKVVLPASCVDDVARLAAAPASGNEVERIGGWRLRYDENAEDQDNAVLAVGDPGCPLPTAVETAKAFYAERDRSLVVQVPYRGDAPILDYLVSLGATVSDPTIVLTAYSKDVAEYRREGAPNVNVTATSNTVKSRTDRADQTLVAVTDGETATGTGICVERWTLVTTLNTTSSYRRQGHASAVVQALVGRSTCALGAVPARNDEAFTLMRKLGFVIHHEHRFAIFRTSERS